eukprot:TRINITY_DN8511_c0_g1_i3.p1 TRINITY_DN8511_c0_g1~~TRINITY_DN8511_c0_g1_i3.p1  ORF type:complete len:196 (+),score=-21.95 TRINITY_DN8511_c0_g1_i3:171-758(+)
MVHQILLQFRLIINPQHILLATSNTHKSVNQYYLIKIKQQFQLSYKNATLQSFWYWYVISCVYFQFSDKNFVVTINQRHKSFTLIFLIIVQTFIYFGYFILTYNYTTFIKQMVMKILLKISNTQNSQKSIFTIVQRKYYKKRNKYSQLVGKYQNCASNKKTRMVFGMFTQTHPRISLSGRYSHFTVVYQNLFKFG